MCVLCMCYFILGKLAWTLRRPCQFSFRRHMPRGRGRKAPPVRGTLYNREESHFYLVCIENSLCSVSGIGCAALTRGEIDRIRLDTSSETETHHVVEHSGSLF